MFFFLSKTAGLLIQPLVVVSILFLTGLLLRKLRSKKILLWSSFGLLMVFCNYFLAIQFMRAWEIPAVPFSEVKGPYDYGVLLTGITRGKAGPPDRVYFSRADRATHTVQLYKLGLIKKVLISGGSGSLDNSGIREADELAPFLAMAGIREEDIVIENESRNTHDSAYKVAELLGKMNEPSARLLLITSGYHLRRARACFEKAGLHPDVFATDPHVTQENFTTLWIVVPNLEAVLIWQSLIKEWVGTVIYWMAGYI
jgi:uncharacterized SAM-binding protein YcdF (DUF218 family)